MWGCSAFWFLLKTGACLAGLAHGHVLRWGLDQKIVKFDVGLIALCKSGKFPNIFRILLQLS